jgi:hypothetical protein
VPLHELKNLFCSCKRNGVLPTRFVLVVSVAKQTVSLFEKAAVALDDHSLQAPTAHSPAAAIHRYQFLKKFRCSTSRFGIGQMAGSNGTPLGLHRIVEKIGAGEPAGTVFKARQVVGHTSQPEFADAEITTRILWLEGLEPGVNRGGKVDSHARYIYLHGTADQASIGKPASYGCIHLADADLIPLFDQLPSGTLVWIGR